MARFSLLAAPWAALVLAACSTPQPLPPPPAKALCLPVVSYSQAQGKELVAEKNRLRDHSMIDRYLAGYSALRDAARAACR
jgi:hypothetical protein